MNDIIYAQKTVREAEYYEKKMEWDMAAKFHKKASELFEGLIEGVDNEVDKEYLRLKEKHLKRYEQCIKNSQVQEKKIPKSEPIKIQHSQEKKIGSGREDEESEKRHGMMREKNIPKSSSYPSREKKYEPILLQKEKYVESKNREILIVGNNNNNNGNYNGNNNSGEGNNNIQNVKNLIWKGLDLLINGIQKISTFSSSLNDNNSQNINNNNSLNRNNNLISQNNNNNNNKMIDISSKKSDPESLLLREQALLEREKKLLFLEKKYKEKKEKRKQKKQRKREKAHDGMESVILESSIPKSSFETVQEENEKLKEKVESLEKKNSKLFSLKNEAKRIIRENQILKESFVNMKNSLLVSSFDDRSSDDSGNILLSSFIGLLSSTSSLPHPPSSSSVVGFQNQSFEGNESNKIDFLNRKIQILEQKCEKQSKIIQDYHQKWEDLKKSAKERREKRSGSVNENK